MALVPLTAYCASNPVPSQVLPNTLLFWLVLVLIPHSSMVFSNLKTSTSPLPRLQKCITMSNLLKPFAMSSCFIFLGAARRKFTVLAAYPRWPLPAIKRYTTTCSALNKPLASSKGPTYSANTISRNHIWWLNKLETSKKHTAVNEFLTSPGTLEWGTRETAKKCLLLQQEKGSLL